MNLCSHFANKTTTKKTFIKCPLLFRNYLYRQVDRQDNAVQWCHDDIWLLSWKPHNYVPNTDFTRCSSLMSTNMVAFLLLTKHREVRNCSDTAFFGCWGRGGVRAAGLRGYSDTCCPYSPTSNPDHLFM